MGIICLVIGGLKIYSAGEINLKGDVGSKTIEEVYVCGGTVEDHSGRCLQTELLVSADILSQITYLTKLLKFLGDCDFMHRFLELCKEFGLV